MPGHPATCIADIDPYDQDILAAIDKALELMECPSQHDSPCLSKYRRLLALRHEHVDRLLYSKTAAPCPHLPPRVVLSTISFLDSLPSTSEFAQGVEHRLLIVDDFHQCSMHGLLPALAPFDCVVLAGDSARLRMPSAERETPRVRDAPVLPAPRELEAHVEPPAPGQMLAADWVSALGKARFTLKQTYGLGPSVVACLKAMSPESWPEMTSASGTDTVVFPLLFLYLRDEEGPPTSDPLSKVVPEPIEDSESVFVYAALTIALELIADGEEPVLCLAFCPHLLKAFRNFLQSCMEGLLELMAGCCDMKGPPVQTLEECEQTGRLTFLTVDKADHVTSHVAILLALRQHTTDECWTGPALLDRALRYVALTRASKRLYVFAEDLRRWVYAPRPPTAHTADIIRLHNLELQLSVNGGQCNDDLVVAADDTEFEAQAEWSSLLWWLQNQHWALSKSPFKRIEVAWSPVPPIFVAIARAVFPDMPWIDAKWNSALRSVAIHHAGWHEARYPQPWHPPPHATPAQQGSFYNPGGLINALPLRRMLYQPVPQLVCDEADDIRIGQAWAQAAIGEVTVHVEDGNKVTVIIPLNSRLFQHRHCLDLSRANSELDKLGSVLARDAVCVFNQARCGGAVLKYGREQHKRRHYVQRGDMELEVAQYCASHPAFFGADVNNTGTHILYLYRADGLQRQHPHQVTLIGRCTEYSAAAALLRAVETRLGLLYRRCRVRFWAEVTPRSIDQWDNVCRRAGLRPFPGPPTIRELFQEDPSDDFRAVLRNAARATHATLTRHCSSALVTWG